MKRVFLLDVYEKHVNGFSTYKKAIQTCLGKYPVELYQIIENSPVQEVKIDKKGKIIRFHIPYIPDINPCQYYYFVIYSLLKQYIQDSQENIFMLNYSPAYRVLKTLKECFHMSKTIYIIHDFIWAHYVLGDIEKFKKVIHENQHEKNLEYIQKAYEDNRKAFAISDKIVCLSQDTLYLLKSFYQIPLAKISFIPNGLRDFYKGKQFVHMNNNRKKILAVGRVTKQKGMLDLLYCFKEVINRYPDCQLIIAGHIKEESLCILDAYIKEHICFLGEINKTELYDLYTKVDIGVIPSYYEQCSYVGIEMKMFGLPIVASDAFGLRNMFNEENALIASIDRENEKVFQHHLSESIVQMLTCLPDKLLQYRQKSRESFLNGYRIKNMQHKYWKLINNL